MEQILEIREILISYYKRYEMFIGFILKFLLGATIYSFIGSIGYSADAFSAITDSALKFPYILIMGVLFSVLPLNVNYGFIILNITMQFSSKLEVAAIVCMVLLLVFCFYGRLGGKESTLIVAIFFAFYLKIPCVVPIFAGLYLGLTSIIPIIIGVLLWNLTPIAMELGATAETAGTSIMDMPSTFSQLYITMSTALKDTQDWAVTAFIFAMVVIVVYVVSKLEIDYAKDIAIGLGVALNVVCFLLAMAFTDFSTGIFSLLFFSLLSGVVIEVVKFFDYVLDYQRAEKIEFEDEDNYYFVKVIPKIVMSPRNRSLKRIAPGEPERRPEQKRREPSTTPPNMARDRMQEERQLRARREERPMRNPRNDDADY